MGLFWAVPAFADDVIRIASPYQTTTLDPMRSAAAINIETYGQLYSRLLRRNAETGALGAGARREVGDFAGRQDLHLPSARCPVLGRFADHGCRRGLQPRPYPE